MEDDNTSESDALLMNKNGLHYKMPQSLSTTVNRTFKREYAQRASYSAGETIVFDLNTGTSYVDPQNAMLRFDIQPAYTGTAGDVNSIIGFGSGAGACSVLQEIRLMSKNGTEIDRIQNANILAKILSDWSYDTQGQSYLEMTLKGETFLLAAPAAREVVIPLKLVCGFFRPTVRDMLIPAGLASGMRIEITLAPAARALQITAGPGTVATYTVTDPELLLMLHDLNDSTQAVLMSESASNGLEYTFPSYFSTNLTSASLQQNIQVAKAVSQATRVFSTAYLADTVNVEAGDGFRAINSSKLTNFQYRVGSSYYPQAPISKKLEAWYVTSAAFGKNDHTDLPNSVNYAGYVSDDGGKFLVGVPLETSSKLNLSGLPINNSSVLELRMVLNGAANHEFVVFLEYVTVARTFVNRTTIKI